MHVAIGDIRSITLRNKLKRMGLEGEHIDDLISLVDEIGIQKSLSDMPLGVRYSTVKAEKNKPKIWRG